MASTATTQVDLTKVKPYGDTLNDGMMELGFTLPVPYHPLPDLFQLYLTAG